MTVKKFDLPLTEQVGYDYIQTLRELRAVMTLAEIADVLSYSHASPVLAILKGTIPNHVRGEALWALYIERFGHKPPLRVTNLACPPRGS